MVAALRCLSILASFLSAAFLILTAFFLLSIFRLPARSEVKVTGQHLWHSHDGEHNCDICSRLQVLQGRPLFHRPNYTRQVADRPFGS